MRAITVYPEWAWAICHLDKRVENRSRPLPKAMAGPLVALHAGKYIGGRPGSVARAEGGRAVAGMAREAAWDVFGGLTFRKDRVVSLYEDPVCTSAIVAFVRFGPSVPPDQGDLTGWRVPDCHGWPIVEVLRLKEPVPAKGALGFWELPAEILRRCREVGTREDEQLPLFDGEISRRSGVCRSVVGEMRRRMRIPAKVHRNFRQGGANGS